MRLACWPFEVEGQGAGEIALRPPATEAPAVLPPNETPAVQPPTEPPATQPAPTEPPIVKPIEPTASPSPPPVPLPRPTLPQSLPLHEEARYDIRYGIFGLVGELSFSVGGVTEGPDGSRVVKVQGSGQGAVWGLGTMKRHINAEFDPGTLGSRRWSVLRLRDGENASQGTVDSAAIGNNGAFLLERTKPGEPPSRQTVAFSAPTSDPLGLLWRLRTAPPRAGQTETFQLLDGLTLWRVRVTTSAVGELLQDVGTPAMRLDGEIAPIFYDGRPDPQRPIRPFTLWLTDSSNHLPLRLEVPVGLADVVMTLSATRRLTQALPEHDSRPGLDTARGFNKERSLQVSGPVPGARSL